MEKFIEIDKIENIERIEIGTKIRKLKEPEGRDNKKILKSIKWEKEQEKLKMKGRVIELEGIERKKS